MARWALLVAMACEVGCAQVASEQPADAAPETLPDAGRTLTVPIERTWSQLTRSDGRFSLLVEVYPVAVGSCAPSAAVSEDLLALGLVGWDGRAGTFPFGVETARGRAMLSIGLREREVKGSLTIEPFAGKPRYVTYETDTLGGGTLDISRCEDFAELK